MPHRALLDCLAAPARQLLACSTIALLLPGIAAHAQDTGPVLADFSEFEQLAQRRVGRVEIEYDYRLVMSNGSSALEEALVTVESLAPATVIVDGEARFGAVAADQLAESQDSITIRQNRRVPFDPAMLVFTIDATPAADDGGLGFITDNPTETAVIDETGGTLVAVDDNGSVITLDVPALSVLDETSFTVTSIDEITGLPDSISVLGGAVFGPPGTRFLVEPTISFTPGDIEGATGPIFGFYAEDDGSRLLLRPLIADPFADPLAGALGDALPAMTLPHFTGGSFGQSSGDGDLPPPPLDATPEERFYHIATRELTAAARRQIEFGDSVGIGDALTDELLAALSNFIGESIETDDGGVVRTGLTFEYFDLLLAPELDQTRFREFLDFIRSVLTLLTNLQSLYGTDEIPELGESIATFDELTDLTLTYRAGLLLSCWKEPPSQSENLSGFLRSTAAILKFLEETDLVGDPMLDCFDAEVVRTYIPEDRPFAPIFSGTAFNQTARSCEQFDRVFDQELNNDGFTFLSESVVVTNDAPLTVELTLASGPLFLRGLGFDTLTLTFDAPDGEKSTGSISAVALPNVFTSGGTLGGTVTATPTRLEIDAAYDVTFGANQSICASRDGNITAALDFTPLDFTQQLQRAGVLPDF